MHEYRNQVNKTRIHLLNQTRKHTNARHSVCEKEVSFLLLTFKVEYYTVFARIDKGLVSGRRLVH